MKYLFDRKCAFVRTAENRLMKTRGHERAPLTTLLHTLFAMLVNIPWAT